MRENNRKSIASIKKFPQFTIMNVIDVQAGLIICASLIFYSLTTDNILNIIVLLILAGISISMLSGDNGLLTRTTDAKERTGIAEVVENAKLDVLAQIAENKGQNISKDQLKNILDKYFEDIATLELPDDLSNSDIKLNANQTYGGYKNIALSEIYNGTFSTTNSTNPVPDITKYKWRLFIPGEGEADVRCSKDGYIYIYSDGESERWNPYTLDGDKFAFSVFETELELEWDGEKFVEIFDDGEGGTLMVTLTKLTEIITSTFTFTIDGTEYTAEEGMTWADWVASDYNTGNNHVVEGDMSVYVGDLTVIYVKENGNVIVSKNQLIDNTIEYLTEDYTMQE